MPDSPPPSMSRRSFLKLTGLALLASACQPRELPKPALSATDIPPGSRTPMPFQPGSTGTPIPTTAAVPSPEPAPSPTTAQEPFFLVDGHVDLAWNVLEFGRNPHLAARDTRLAELGSPVTSMVGESTTSFPDWRDGGFGLLFTTIFVIPAANAYPGYTRIAYSNAQEANRAGLQVLEYYHTLVSEDPLLVLVQNRQDLAALKARRLAGEQAIGLVLVMEGADPILDPQDLPSWYDAGLRIIGPAWHATRYAGGTSQPGPLSEPGYRLLDEMARLNMLLDLSHLAEEAYYQAVDYYAGPLIASHSNPRHFVPGDRFLSDDMIRKLAGRGGVIGVSLYNAHLQQGWRRGDARPSLSRVAEVVDYIAQVTGSPETVALGTDMDGGFGLDSIPQEIDTAADVEKIAGLMKARGYTEENIRAVLMENWLRVLEPALIG